ncbi:hypothetical protein E2C01_038258 [Portunus trituberculatus]|uniref:Uncharacterized protein n=1 Tax=Portunus trituberculatus TaxID=210409 RepID=A0A5B7FAD5_PORTR|nr:hypothetical protein [Portunus trituberculatus]
MPVRGSHGGTSSRCTRLSESKRSCLSWDVICSRGGVWRKYRRSFVTYPRCRRSVPTSPQGRRTPAVNSSSRVRYGTDDNDGLHRLFYPFTEQFMKLPVTGLAPDSRHTPPGTPTQVVDTKTGGCYTNDGVQLINTEATVRDAASPIQLHHTTQYSRLHYVSGRENKVSTCLLE